MLAGRVEGQGEVMSRVGEVALRVEGGLNNDERTLRYF